MSPKAATVVNPAAFGVAALRGRVYNHRMEISNCMKVLFVGAGLCGAAAVLGPVVGIPAAVGGALTGHLAIEIYAKFGEWIE